MENPNRYTNSIINSELLTFFWNLLQLIHQNYFRFLLGIARRRPRYRQSRPRLRFLHDVIRRVTIFLALFIPRSQCGSSSGGRIVRILIQNHNDNSNELLDHVSLHEFNYFVYELFLSALKNISFETHLAKIYQKIFLMKIVFNSELSVLFVTKRIRIWTRLVTISIREQKRDLPRLQPVGKWLKQMSNWW